MREMLDQMRCARCTANQDQLDTNKLDYETANALLGPHSCRPVTLIFESEDETETDNENESDSELSELQFNNHCYHLSWAVFTHLPCEYSNILWPSHINSC